MVKEITREEVIKYAKTLVHNRASKEEIEQMFSEHFDKEIRFDDTTDEDDTDLDYLMTANIIGDNDECGYWFDVDLYYLKMRNGEYYITEYAVAEY